MRRALLLVLPTALAACASGVPVTRQVVVPAGHFEAVQGEARFVVRTFLPPEGDTRREVTGAACTLRTSLYQVDFVTPAQVVVPNFGPQSPEIAVTCRTPDAEGRAASRIFTRWQQPPGYWGDPIYGPWAGPWGPGWGPWGWGGGPGYPISSYPNLGVTLRPVAG